jgi:flagellar motor protein MotB
VSYFITAPPRVGRSQGASIFWGLISVCFAAAACFYFWKNHENETSANLWRDQALHLQEENETLASQKDHLQASMSDEEAQMKTREDLINQKEQDLAGEESKLDSVGRQSQSQTQQSAAQTAMVRRFNDTIKKVARDTPPDVVERGGRPVLRVPNGQLFAAGSSALTPDGKTMLSQMAQSFAGQMDGFELRVVCYTDTDAENPAPAGAAATASKDAHGASWDLTAARAASLARFFRDQTQLPPLGVLVLGRGDSEPIASNTGDNRARNRRTEFSITPQPPAFRPPEATPVNASGPVATTPASSSSPAPAAKGTKSKKALPVTPLQTP